MITYYRYIRIRFVLLLTEFFNAEAGDGEGAEVIVQLNIAWRNEVRQTVVRLLGCRVLLCLLTQTMQSRCDVIATAVAVQLDVVADCGCAPDADHATATQTAARHRATQQVLCVVEQVARFFSWKKTHASCLSKQK